MKRISSMIIIATLLSGCSHMSVRSARRLIRDEREDRIVRAHMNRRQGEKTNAEMYGDEWLRAKWKRHKWHLPKDGMIAILAYVLREIRKRRRLEETIAETVNGRKGDDEKG